MRQKRMIAALAGGCVFIGVAAAHPGPKLLTAGGAETRAAMTPGVSYENVDGVHVFRGSEKEEAVYSPTETAARHEIEIDVTHRFVWRSFRRLRTQGFFSGTDPKSRRFTQGFYSGR